MCHDRAALASQSSWSVGRQEDREVHDDIDSSERESLCPGRAALGGEDELKINSPHAKEIVVAALTAAGKEAGLKVRSFYCMGAGLGTGADTKCRTLDPDSRNSRQGCRQDTLWRWVLLAFSKPVMQ